jgi:hypothetical protein
MEEKDPVWKPGDFVRFAHIPPGGPRFKVLSVGTNGMVTVEGMAGEFGPHIFVAETAPALGQVDEADLEV